MPDEGTFRPYWPLWYSKYAPSMFEPPDVGGLRYPPLPVPPSQSKWKSPFVQSFIDAIKPIVPDILGYDPRISPPSDVYPEGIGPAPPAPRPEEIFRGPVITEKEAGATPADIAAMKKRILKDWRPLYTGTSPVESPGFVPASRESVPYPGSFLQPGAAGVGTPGTIIRHTGWPNQTDDRPLLERFWSYIQNPGERWNPDLSAPKRHAYPKRQSMMNSRLGLGLLPMALNPPADPADIFSVPRIAMSLLNLPSYLKQELQGIQEAGSSWGTMGKSPGGGVETHHEPYGSTQLERFMSGNPGEAEVRI